MGVPGSGRNSEDAAPVKLQVKSNGSLGSTGVLSSNGCTGVHPYTHWLGLDPVVPAGVAVDHGLLGLDVTGSDQQADHVGEESAVAVLDVPAQLRPVHPLAR